MSVREERPQTRASCSWLGTDYLHFSLYSKCKKKEINKYEQPDKLLGDEHYM